MARVRFDEDVPSISRPVGSLDEVKELAGPHLTKAFTRNIASCSEHRDRENRGCDEWESCDRTFRGSRPQLEVVEFIGSGGNVRVMAIPCYAAIKKERNDANKGTSTRVIGGEGSEYTYQGSEKLHLRRDPDCNLCVKGECHLSKDSEFTAVCGTFPAAETHPDLRKFARKIVARTRGSVNRREEARARLLGGEDESDVGTSAAGPTDNPRLGRGPRKA